MQTLDLTKLSTELNEYSIHLNLLSIIKAIIFYVGVVYLNIHTQKSKKILRLLERTLDFTRLQMRTVDLTKLSTVLNEYSIYLNSVVSLQEHYDCK